MEPFCKGSLTYFTDLSIDLPHYRVVFRPIVTKNGKKGVVMKRFSMVKHHFFPMKMSKEYEETLANKVPEVTNEIINYIDKRTPRRNA